MRYLIAIICAALFITILLTGCTRITLPGGATYTNFAQDKSYSIEYDDPNSGQRRRADINVKNDPLIKALGVSEKALDLAAKGAVAP